jgi:hypothetical protein
MCILGRRWQRCKIRVGWQRKWLGRSNNTNVTGRLACFGGCQIPSPTNCQIPPLPHILERSLLTLPIPLPDAPHCASAHPSLWLWSPSRHPHPPGSRAGALLPSKPRRQGLSAAQRSGGHLHIIPISARLSIATRHPRPRAGIISPSHRASSTTTTCDRRPRRPLGAAILRSRPDTKPPVATAVHVIITTSTAAPRCPLDSAYIASHYRAPFAIDCA